MRYTPLLILLAGCIQVGQESKPQPSGRVNLQSVAKEAGDSYLNGLADMLDETAIKAEAGEYKANAQVYDEVKAKSNEVRREAFGKWEEALDGVVPAKGKHDGKKLGAALRASAKGFRR
jgi:hypothetical protein